MKLGNKGQSAWFDILIIFLTLMVFTALMWTYTITAKSPTTNNQMRMADYTQSLLLRTLYSTYIANPSTDTRYDGKSISDLLGMYLSNTKAFAVDSKGQPTLIKKAIEQVVSNPTFQSRPEGQLEWFIFDAEDEKGFCLHVYQNQLHQNQVQDCDILAVSSNAFTSAIADVYTAKSNGVLGSGLQAGYNTKKVKLTVVWARTT